jgi:hypothetical protein
MAAEPVVVHDFTKQPGQTVQLDRYRFWGEVIAPLIRKIKENSVNCWNPSTIC